MVGQTIWIKFIGYLYGLVSLLIFGAALYVIFCPQASLLGGMLMVVCAAFILFFIEYYIITALIEKFLEDNPES